MNINRVNSKIILPYLFFCFLIFSHKGYSTGEGDRDRKRQKTDKKSEHIPKYDNLEDFQDQQKGIPNYHALTPGTTIIPGQQHLTTPHLNRITPGMEMMPWQQHMTPAYSTMPAQPYLNPTIPETTMIPRQQRLTTPHLNRTAPGMTTTPEQQYINQIYPYPSNPGMTMAPAQQHTNQIYPYPPNLGMTMAPEQQYPTQPHSHITPGTIMTPTQQYPTQPHLNRTAKMIKNTVLVYNKTPKYVPDKKELNHYIEKLNKYIYLLKDDSKFKNFNLENHSKDNIEILFFTKEPDRDHSIYLKINDYSARLRLEHEFGPAFDFTKNSIHFFREGGKSEEENEKLTKQMKTFLRFIKDSYEGKSFTEENLNDSKIREAIDKYKISLEPVEGSVHGEISTDEHSKIISVHASGGTTLRADSKEISENVQTIREKMIDAPSKIILYMKEHAKAIKRDLLNASTPEKFKYYKNLTLNYRQNFISQYESIKKINAYNKNRV